MERKAYTIAELLEIHPGGRTAIYEAIRAGQLVARKIGRQTVILDSEYNDYLKSLPKLDLKRAEVAA